MEMSTNDLGKSRGDSLKWIKIAVCLGLSLGVSTTILNSITLVQVNKGFDDNKDSPSACQISSETDEDRIPCMFPGFFRTKAELDNILKLNKTFPVYSLIGRSEGGPILHGCCNSSNTWAIPTNMTDVYGKQRKIEQFKGRKQFIQEETCITSSNCFGCPCACTQLWKIITLVCDNGARDHSFCVFKIPGCCNTCELSNISSILMVAEIM